MVSVLTQCFKPDGHEEAYKAEFRRKTKTKEESSLEFGHRLRQLAIRAFPKIKHESRRELVMDYNMVGVAVAMVISTMHEKSCIDSHNARKFE